MQPILHALRGFRRRPGIPATVVLLLALGLGVGTALFGAARTLLIGTVPVAKPDRLVALYSRNDQGAYGYLSLPDVRDLRRGSRGLDGLAAYTDIDLALGDGDGTVRIPAQAVTSDYFAVLGLSSLWGGGFERRGLEPAQSAAEPRIVLGHAAWQRRFAGDPSLLGSSVRVNRPAVHRRGHRAGGLPRHRSQPTGRGLGAPRPLPPGDAGVPADLVENRDSQWLVGLGRRASGASFEQVEQELSALYANREGGSTAGSAAGARWHVAVLPGRSGSPWPPARQEAAHLVRLAALGAGLLLLIVCANVSVLLLARFAGRQEQNTLRLALGAKRSSLVWLTVGEVLLLAIGGGLVALPVAGAVLRLLEHVAGGGSGSSVVRFSLDPAAVAFAAALAVVAGLASALAPSLALSTSHLRTTLGEGAAASLGGRRRAWLQRAFTVAQVALATLVLCADGLLLAGYLRASATDLGYDPRGVVLASVDPGLSGMSAEGWSAAYERVREELASRPGVDGAAVAFVAPFSGLRFSRGVVVPGRPATPEGYTDVVAGNLVSPGYFQVLGIPVLAGRAFTGHDGEDGPRVAVVSRSLAETLWPEGSALGRGFDLWSSQQEPAPLTVVGIVADARQGAAVGEKPGPRMYLPLAQNPVPSAVVVARGRQGTAELGEVVRSAVRGAAPQLALYDVRSLSEQVARSLGAARSAALLLTSLGFLSIVLALAGLYGVLSYVWNQRIREVGLRMALGASRGGIVRLVLARGLGLMLVGVAVGLAPAPFLAGWLEPWLGSGAIPGSWIIGSVAAAVLAAGAAAVLIPAWRTSRVAPLTSLRQL